MSDDCSAVAIVSHAGHFGPSSQSQASNVSQFPSTPHAVTPVATSGTNRVTEPLAAQCSPGPRRLGLTLLANQADAGR